MNSKPFQVINCLSQGFAVAGPVLADGHHERQPDLEMVLWGVSFAKACEMAEARELPRRVCR